MSKAAIVCISISVSICFAACATGGNGGGGNNDTPDAAVVRNDASMVTTPDAFVRLDGGVVVQPDAQVSQTPDAATGGLFCTANSQCTVSGECCLTLGGPSGFCAPGTVVFGECFPQ